MVEDSERSWRLAVASGPNEGAVVPLGGGRYRIGIDPRNDIVLAEASMAAEQALFEIDAQGLRVTALAGGATIRHRALDVGSPLRVACGTEIRIGATLLRVEGPRRAAPRAPALLALAVLAVAASAALGFRAATPRVLAGAGDGASVAARPAATLAQAASALRAHLRAGGIGGVAVAVAADGIVAHGAIAAPQGVAWLDARKWFDARYGQTAMLRDDVRTRSASDGSPLALAAVSTVPFPVAIARDGSRYMEGAVLDGGWVVRHITTRAVTLARDGETVTLTL